MIQLRVFIAAATLALVSAAPADAQDASADEPSVVGLFGNMLFMAGCVLGVDEGGFAALAAREPNPMFGVFEYREFASDNPEALAAMTSALGDDFSTSYVLGSFEGALGVAVENEDGCVAIFPVEDEQGFVSEFQAFRNEASSDSELSFETAPSVQSAHFPHISTSAVGYQNQNGLISLYRDTNDDGETAIIMARASNPANMVQVIDAVHRVNERSAQE